MQAQTADTTDRPGVGAGESLTGPDTLRIEVRAVVELDQEVSNAIHGDGIALRRLYDELSPRIAVYLRLRGAEDPEGLTNDVFLDVFMHLDKLKGGWQGFRAMAFTVAHSRMVDDRRRQARQPRLEEYNPAQDSRVDSSAEQQALATIGETDITQLLALLPEEQRVVVTLRVLGDLTVAQTAQALRTSQGRVKKLQQRAVFALRRLIGDSHEPDGRTIHREIYRNVPQDADQNVGQTGNEANDSGSRNSTDHGLTQALTRAVAVRDPASDRANDQNSPDIDEVGP